ncbi:MAG: AbrB/MazE/SpoVT family DNA-binding domain-containing protein [Candidatus Omnitrophica bacterium]|nr:AbrB/MazE/SpoVT family DNA-binding domain-containing protein [Candidatus Omnitrophota bacterium]
MLSATVNKDGRITLPKEMRSEYQLEPGDRIQFEIRDGELWMILPSKDITDLKGLFPDKPKEPRTLAEMEEGIVEGAMKSMSELKTKRKS